MERVASALPKSEESAVGEACADVEVDGEASDVNVLAAYRMLQSKRTPPAEADAEGEFNGESDPPA